MTTVFYLAASAMLAFALALLLVPLVRQGRRDGRSRGVFALAVVVALALPTGSAALYMLVGTPATLGGVEAPKPMSLDQGIEALLAHLKASPDDPEGWMLLGQAYAMGKRPAEARDAYGHVLTLLPDNVAAMVGWAEADSLARDDHRIDGRALDLLERAASLEPANQRALWLLGIAQFQKERYPDAIATWQRLQPLLDPDSNVAHAVAKQIAVAQARVAAGPGNAATGNMGGTR
ncbi:Cytochrome c-type biogenesis protein CcmH/NrfG [Luteibacter sp. UNCMF331Sha3.1]|uniref:tetratricopeptide repeat protein n=1 Tax=Luteibacter sp. UNCMF331Sha3.1 TaxID=1502760 RepID=UPI0008D67B9F|nr:tetratricopeptide repeat protein [Luteibacter sp. UNCMF331Sha3.1]SEN35972.1 Cytochrome c-type biogenesis protein CcmH/NrfG [Luteibacter sp. UNCMF331Sha3.1]